jgi:hypothetical protein
MEHEPDDDVSRLWRTQTGEETPMPLHELRARAGTLGRTVRRRNLLEYAAGVAVFVLFGRLAADGDAHVFVRLGAGLVVAATVFILFYMHAKGWVPRAADDEASVEYYRAELRRQRDLLRAVWWWYLLPFVPGFLLITIGRVAADPERATRVAIGTLIALLVFLGIGTLNARKAAKIQQDIDALDAHL